MSGCTLSPAEVRGESVYRRTEALAEADGVAQRRVLLALAEPDAVPIVLEGSAIAIWDAIDGIHSVMEITESLATAFGVAAADILEDVISTIRSFITWMVIEDVERQV